MEAVNGESVLELLCAPLPEGQAVLELHLRQRILEETELYGRRRRIRHTFFVRAGDRIAKFQVTGRVSLLPMRISIPEIQELVTEAIDEEIAEVARALTIERGVLETDPDFAEAYCQMVREGQAAPNYQARIAHHTQRFIRNFTRDGVVIEGD